MKKYLYLILSVTVIFIFAVTVALNAGTATVEADGISTPLSGWAWSSNIGWISFNSNDSGAGGGPYAVTMSTTTTTGTITGYAWSPNIGWIKFGDLSNIPNSGNNVSVDMTNGKVSGFARACIGTVNRDCNSADASDGWTGWIELSGTNHDSPIGGGAGGVTFDPASGRFSGYSWSNDIGWISFNTSVPVGTGPNNPSYNVAATCTLDDGSNPKYVNSGSTVTYAAHISGDGWSGTKTYSWNSISPTCTSYLCNQTVTTSLTPSVTVSDSASHNAFASCPTVGVNHQQSSNLGLLIGSNAISATQTSYTVSKGKVFGLAPSIPSNYTGCSITPAAINLATMDSSWNQSGSPLGIWNGKDDLYKTSNKIDSISTSNASIGDFTFTLACTNDGNGNTPTPASVSLHVSHPEIIEF